jgi:hypothetical protein
LERDALMLDSSFDPLALAVDWLDSCRARSLENLLELYDARGSLSCACAGPYIYQGREDIARYWSPRLEKAVPHAFSLTELTPADSNDRPCVLLDHVGYDGKPVQVRFLFTKAGKIAQTICTPVIPPAKAEQSRNVRMDQAN